MAEIPLSPPSPQKNNPTRLLDTQINWEITNKLRKEPKYANFIKWAQDNGAIFPSVFYVDFMLILG